ncbi:MFS transporter [Microlunatus sp. GCM10028923]|uniref:MFS transporter n=1 Tax=Microlunatus sp. GCM10028923 TaxID=3273400 RepID=UPI00360C4179
MRSTANRRLVGALQVGTATVEGVVLSTIVLQVALELDLAAPLIGLILALGAASSLILAVPLGDLADRLGLSRAAALFAGIAAVAVAGYAITDSAAGFAVAAIAFGIAQSTSAAARQALAVDGAAAADRLTIRATMNLLLNAGIGLGTVLGAVLAASGLGPTTRIAYGVGAVIMVLTAAGALALRRPVRPVRRSGWVGTLIALRDRRFAAATGFAAAIQLTMPVLSVILPIWVLQQTAAPIWLSGVALGLNTLLVIIGQRPYAARVRTHRATVRTALIAAGGLGVAGALLAVSGAVRSPLAVVVLILAGIVALTVGEVCGGIATWRVALDHVPDGAEGRYQAAFSMSTSAARIVGPAVALPLVIMLGPAGWLILTAVMAAACLGIAALAQAPITRSATPRGAVRS